MLINFLGDHNHPELAARAGDEPLDEATDPGNSDPLLEVEDLDVEMEGRDRGSTVEQEALMQAAQNALDVSTHAEDDEASSVVPTHVRRESSSTPRTLPKILTQSFAPKRDRQTEHGQIGVQEENKAIDSDGKDPSAVDGLLQLKDTVSSQSQTPSSRYGQLNNNFEAESLATSPNLRQYAIPVSEGSPRETLPAMKSSSPQDSSKTPTGQQSLPSLHAQLGSLANPPSSHDSVLRSNGMGHANRPPFAPTNGSVHSPPKEPGSSRPSPFVSLQTRTNGQYPQPYAPTQPSPASTFSEVSPRDPFRHMQDPTTMSPPGKPGAHLLYGNGLTPQSDVQTPLSAESHPSASGYSTDTSPNGDRMSIDGARPALPSLQLDGPLLSGGFKCEHPECTALPFQTQYLLK